MSIRRARAIAYGVVALLGVAAVLFTKPLPPQATTPAGEVLNRDRVEVEEPQWRERHDTVGRGESLVSVLARGGVSEIVAREAIRAAKTLDPRRIPIGLPLRVRSGVDDTMPTEIILQLAVDRMLHLRRSDSGWTGHEERLPWRIDTVVVTGEIQAHLYEAMEKAARDIFSASERQLLTWTLADILEYRVDMSRDLRVGDKFRVLVERRIAPNGAVRVGDIVAATMTLSGATTEAVRFASNKVRGDYFDAQGKSLRAGFLRTPVAFRRISSNFGMRRHPILGTMRQHAGLDYAANAGTPIRAIGDGTVIRAGWHGGYGNVVEIRHANGFVSRYAHMRRFGKGIRAGVRVTQAQVIGEVGSTGLSTAPHLHFEVLVNGVHRDPRQALKNASSDPIPATERVAFAETRSRFMALLDSPAVVASAEGPAVRQAGSSQ